MDTMSARKLITIAIILLMAVSVGAQTKDYGAYASRLQEAVDKIGKKHALVIGVEYPPPHSLDWTMRDAEEIGKALRTIYGFEVELLVKKDQTTRAGITRALSRLKQTVKEENDQVVVFFSGHGVPDPDSSEVGYLVPSDGRREDLFSTCVPMERLQSLSRAMRPRHLLFIIDTCYSGIIGGFAEMDFDPARDTQSLVQANLGMRARQVITAGRSNEKALMAPDKRMSVYSYYLHRGLTPQAGLIPSDVNQDRVVTVRELQEYVLGKVFTDTRGHQNPRIYNFTSNDGQFVFVPVAAGGPAAAKQHLNDTKARLARVKEERRKAEEAVKALEASNREAELKRQIEAEEMRKAEAEKRLAEARQQEETSRRKAAELKRRAKVEATRKAVAERNLSELHRNSSSIEQNEAQKQIDWVKNTLDAKSQGSELNQQHAAVLPDHLSKRAKRYRPIVEKYSMRFNVDPEIVMAIIHTESFFNPRAESHVQALGLMQLIPHLQAREAYRAVYGIDKIPTRDYLFDPKNNIELGTKLMAIYYYSDFNNIQDPASRLYIAICAYNWGPTAVKERIINRHDINVMRGKSVYDLLCRKTPKETMRFLQKVISRAALYREHFSG